MSDLGEAAQQPAGRGGRHRRDSSPPVRPVTPPAPRRHDGMHGVDDTTLSPVVRTAAVPDGQFRPLSHPGDPARSRPAPSASGATVVPGPETALRPAPQGQPAPGAPASRAGRNLPLAILVGAALGTAVLVPLFTWRPGFVLVIGVAVLMGTWEMVRAVQPVEARPPLVPLLAGGLVMVALAWFTGPEALVVGLVLTVVATVLWRLGDGAVGYQRDITAATLIATYVPFPACFAVLLTAPGDGAWRATVFIATVVCSDVGGYAVGVLLGRHPMAPTVSPKKSWEGFAGSMAACVVAGVLFLHLVLEQPWYEGAVFGAAIAVAATLGDLAESMMKRDLGIKDMGSLLPGHGGLMDRLDSLLVAAPVAYLLLTAFAPPG